MKTADETTRASLARRSRFMPLLVALLMLLVPLPGGSDTAGATNTSPSDCSRGAVYSWSSQYGRSWVQQGMAQTYDFGCSASNQTQRWAGLFSQTRNGGKLHNSWTHRSTNHAGWGDPVAAAYHSTNCGARRICLTYLGVHYEVVGQGPPSPWPFAYGYAPPVHN